MIAKHVPMVAARRSNFAELVAYITGPQGKGERVGVVRVTNCNASDPISASFEVLNTQHENFRSHADKTFHLIVSFRPGEIPDELTLKEIEDHLCAGLGFGEHQRVSVVHHDTDNLHMHIAINKIHPTRKTIHEPYHAYHVLGKLCEQLEREHGLEKDNHKPEKAGSENRASDMERNASIESLLSWVKRECAEDMRRTQSWAELHNIMHDHGLRMHERANGLVITAENGLSVKASSVNREFSKSKLESRLGRFTPPMNEEKNEAQKKRYDREPLRSRTDTKDLHDRYKTEQKLDAGTRADEWAKAKARKARLIEDAKRDGRLKRSIIKLLDVPRLAKRLMYAATSKTLREEIASINRRYLHERQEIFENYQQRAWADWLHSKATDGDKDALEALRARANSTGLHGNTVGGPADARHRKQAPAQEPQPDSITKKGTIIYRTGASTIRDDGDKLSVSRGADRAGLETLLGMALERYGSRISVNGSAVFKEKMVQAAVDLDLLISFDDRALENRRQQLMEAKKTKEKKNGNSDGKSAKVRSRTHRNSPGHSQQAGARAGAAGQRSATGAQSDTRSPGQTPPSTARHGLRGVSELGMVHVSDHREVLLPRHVRGHVEHKGSKPAHCVRRDVRRPGRLKSHWPSAKAATEARITPSDTENSLKACKPNIGKVGTSPPPASRVSLQRLSQIGAIAVEERLEGSRLAHSALPPKASVSISRNAQPASAAQLATQKYIAERETTRASGIQLLKHVPFSSTNNQSAEYAGTRNVDGQVLALLKQGNEIIVIPIDPVTAKRLKRAHVGEVLILSAKGTIKTKGWSR